MVYLWVCGWGFPCPCLKWAWTCLVERRRRKEEITNQARLHLATDVIHRHLHLSYLLLTAASPPAAMCHDKPPTQKQARDAQAADAPLAWETIPLPPAHVLSHRTPPPYLPPLANEYDSDRRTLPPDRPRPSPRGIRHPRPRRTRSHGDRGGRPGESGGAGPGEAVVQGGPGPGRGTRQGERERGGRGGRGGLFRIPSLVHPSLYPLSAVRHPFQAGSLYLSLPPIRPCQVHLQRPPRRKHARNPVGSPPALPPRPNPSPALAPHPPPKPRQILGRRETDNAGRGGAGCECEAEVAGRGERYLGGDVWEGEEGTGARARGRRRMETPDTVQSPHRTSTCRP